MSSEPVLPEDEFAGRDETGLQPLTDKTPTEAAEAKKYAKMLLCMVPVIGQVLAWGAYFLGGLALGQQSLYDEKFAFIHRYELGYLFLAAWIMGITRQGLVINANAARAAARLDRPDQHVYKVMAGSGALKDAPYVLMAGTGPQGRFNRAQRGVYNTDETLPLYLADTLLAGSVFGPMILPLVLLWVFGRLTFALKYKQAVKARGAGFAPSMIAEKWTENLVLVCAIKAIFFTCIPF